MPEYTTKLNIPKLLDSDTFSTENFAAIVDAIDENAADQLTLDNHISDRTSHVSFFVATGIANVYSVGVPKGFIVEKGIGISVEFNVNNTGPSTMNLGNTGAKPIKKQNGNDVVAGQLRSGIIYTFRYNGTIFILQGEGASGNAAASDLLSGKTASTDAGDIVGTMPNRGVGGTVIPTTIDQTKASGYYSSDIVIKGDSDLIASNIKKDVNIFDIVGTLDVAALGGRKFASGTIAHGGNATHLQASGGALDFLPKYIMLWVASTNKLIIYNVDFMNGYFRAFDNALFGMDGTNDYVQMGGFRFNKGYTTPSAETYNWIAVG
jgi:hypothetical protein